MDGAEKQFNLQFEFRDIDIWEIWLIRYCHSSVQGCFPHTLLAQEPYSELGSPYGVRRLTLIICPHCGPNPYHLLQTHSCTIHIVQKTLIVWGGPFCWQCNWQMSRPRSGLKVQCTAKNFKNTLPLTYDHALIWLRHLCRQFVSPELKGNNATWMKTHSLWCLIWSCELAVDEAHWNAAWSLEAQNRICCLLPVYLQMTLYSW